LTILGSARQEGDTAAVLEAVLARRPATRIDLKDLDIRHYEYGRPLDGDDFRVVADAMIRHQVIVFATPVYWYSMSGRMKTLFDRFTDLVTVRKDLGRQLEGRSAFVVTCGSEPELPDGFETPFRDTAAYFRMTFGGTFYAQTAKGADWSTALQGRAAAFGNRFFE
jgi:multimeric flavodoxin WrbA